MRKFSAIVQQIIASGNISAFQLAELITPLVTIRDTTAQTEIIIPSVGTFSPNNGLITIEGPRLSQAVDRETYKISYIDPLFLKRELFENGLTGSKLTTYLCFYNTLGSTINGIAPDAPFTDIADMIVSYSGVVDTQGYAIDPDSGTVIAIIEGASPMASLGLVKGFYTSKASMGQVAPSDTSFDQVTIAAAKTTYLWGKP